jgi:hypothetical protein
LARARDTDLVRALSQSTMLSKLTVVVSPVSESIGERVRHRIENRLARTAMERVPWDHTAPGRLDVVGADTPSSRKC